MKCKRCPVCGVENDIRKLTCECGHSLLSVRVTGSQIVTGTTDMQVQPQNAHDPAVREAMPTGMATPATVSNQGVSQAFMKQCPVCGKIVPYNTPSCCNRSLAGIPPYTPTRQEQPEEEDKCIIYVLRSEDGKSKIELSEGDDVIIGREATGSDYLQTKHFVGRKQVRVSVNDGYLSIEHIGTTNPTLVNQEKLLPNTPRCINNNDLIVLGAHPNQSPQPDAAYYRVIRC